MIDYLTNKLYEQRFTIKHKSRAEEDPIIISKQIQDNQYDVLQEIVSKAFRSNMIVAEIGSCTGLSALLLGEVVKKSLGTLYAIDWYKGNIRGDGQLTEEIYKQCNVKQQFLDNMSFFKLDDTVKLIVASSKEASIIFEDGYFDAIFIDGDHSYEGFTSDFELWYPKVKEGGIFFGHDFTACKEALTDINKTLRLPIEVKNDIWWTRKPKND